MSEAARLPPSGPFVPIAVLGISGPKAFVSGTPLQVPFDVVKFAKGDIGYSLGFGARQKPAIAGYSFGFGPGLYIAQAQFKLSVPQGTTLKTGLTIATGSQQFIAGRVVGATNDGDSAFVNALVPVTDTDLDPTNLVLAAIGLSITATGTSGNVIAAELLLYKLTQP